MRVLFFLALVSPSMILGQCTSKSKTQEKYKYKVSVPLTEYYLHEKMFVDSTKEFIAMKSNGYTDKDDATTQVIIDTILYNPQKDKFVVFIITKNSNRNLIVSDDRAGFHFGEKCFYGDFEKGKIKKIINWPGLILTNYRDIDKISSLYKDFFFNALDKRKNEIGESYYKYNIDDVRFWDGPFWEGDNMSPR